MSTANQADKPIIEDDAFLAHIVEDVGLVQLLCSAVHMTGSLAIIRGVATKPPAYNGDGSGGVPPEQAAELRTRALAAIKAWRDAGQPEPYRPTDAEIGEMIDFLVGTRLGEAYTPVIKDEMGYDGDTREYRWPKPVDDARKHANPVLVIGGGMSGLLMAFRLRQAGIPVKVIEKNKGIGGTWHENRYPGCRVDVASHSYSFSFMQDYRWPTLYSPQPELERYFNIFVDRFGLRDAIVFDTEVVRADYDETAHRWAVTMRGPDGRSRIEQARSLVSAVGQLNRGKIPDLSGLESFAGPYFHTSQWRSDVALAGKRVIVVGAAATGTQAIPQIAATAAHTTIFMRSSNWMAVHPEYTRDVRASEQWALDHLPYYAGWQRTLYFNWPFDLTPSRFKIDPDWQGAPPGKLSTSAANEMSRVRLTEGLEKFLADTPELIDKVVPDYPPYMKRPNVIDGSFLRALQRDDVDLVTCGIERVVPNGIVDAEGVLHEADAIVFATGFHTQKFLFPMEIHGRGGVALNEYWDDEPGGLYGIVVPHFPNFYMMYGPNTNLGFNGTLIFNSECQARYIIANIGRMIADDLDEIEVREDVYQRYNDKVQGELKDFVWTLDHTNNWFKNAKGRVTTNSPWSCAQYWRWTRDSDPADFLAPGEHNARLSSRSQGAASPSDAPDRDAKETAPRSEVRA
ncbi:flavin-containing monooxygenase [Sphingomonas bacterium]|uniref:flavin-containing monooxygenase n=1 Tax=Sphingomonas bacterium TaxID=1895847 RepID=UPI0015776762|nr:NAD(P)/FAD-dependent oxidoreductase [Sphingomonas bacterium]